MNDLATYLDHSYRISAYLNKAVDQVRALQSAMRSESEFFAFNKPIREGATWALADSIEEAQAALQRLDAIVRGDEPDTIEKQGDRPRFFPAGMIKG